MRPVFLTGLACSCFLVALGCGDNRPRAAEEKAWRLTASSSVVSVRSGGMVVLRFSLLAKVGGGVAGERVEFAALRETDLAGGTLSASSALTDASGVAVVSLMAGRPTTFQVTAQNPRAEPSRVTVMVFEGEVTTLSVTLALDTGFAPTPDIVRADLSAYAGRPCSTFSPVRPPVPARAPVPLSLGVPAAIRIDPTLTTALLGRAYDAQGALRAVGCVDVTSSTVLPAANARLSLPLAPVSLVPATDYALVERFSLARHNIALRIAAPWQDLTDCPLDPGQFWLDCAVDALGASPGATLDCIPPTLGQSSLADSIASRRGELPAGSACRPGALSDGSASLDAKVAALFPSPALSPAKDLDALVGFTAHALDDFVIDSTMRIDATSSRSMFLGTHLLRSATFSFGGAPVTSDILALGAPGNEARFVEITAQGPQLTVGEHRLALRIGTLSRLAFEQAASVRLSLPPGTRHIVDALFGLAATQPSRKTGCDALDEIVCSEVGGSPGCMHDACTAGQQALGALLLAGFGSADGEDADLLLSGTVDLLDADGDGIGEALGPGPAGQWLAQFRSAGPTESVTGELSAPLP